MGSVYRYDDSRSTVSSRREEPAVKKVTRYIIRDQDDDTRSTYSTRSRRDVEEPRRSVPEYVERDLTVRTRREESRSPLRDYYSRDYKDTDDREIVVRRTVETTEPKREERDLTITRVEERRDDTPPRHEVASPRDRYWERDRDVERYSRTTDYYAPNQPQTIIIRQDPIIIRERVRDDDYQLVRRSDADEERSVVRRDEPRDEEYFYEKRVTERVDDDEYGRKNRRDRDVSPGDSISQAGGRRHQHHDRGYSSDDSMVYVRRVEREYESRESSPDRKKNLAAGVIAGVGAAELLRSHRKKEGRETASGIGRVGRDVGAGALGALAAEGIQRARSLHRERSRRRDSRDRDRDWSDDDRDDRYGRSRSRSRSRRRRSRSRSESHSRLKTLGALGLGAAAVAAAATIASKRMSKKDEEAPEKRTGRSRTRDDSVESLSELENDPTADDARNPRHRNSRIAAAGAVGAAGAALIERARSKSAGRSGRDRSRSRIRQGLPIAAAGLGTAAIAGLYEKNKAKREAEKIQADQKLHAREHRAHSHQRGSSRGRTESDYQDHDSRQLPPPGVDDRYIEYGHGPMHGNNYGKDYYGQGPAQEPYYQSREIVPASRERARSRSVSHDRRNRSISPASETDRRQSRRDLGLAGAAAAAGGLAAAEHERKKQEKRDRKQRRREQERSHGEDPYDDGYPPQQGGYIQQDPYSFGNESSLPRPPGSIPQQYPNNVHSMFQNSMPQPEPAVVNNTYQPPANNTFGAQPTFPAANSQYGNQEFPPPNPQAYNSPYGQYQTARNRGPEENVSSGSPFPQSNPNNQNQSAPDGVNSPRPKQTPPTINIVSPSIAEDNTPAASMPNLTIPATYNPEAERSSSQPPIADSSTNTKSTNDRPVNENSRSPDLSNQNVPDSRSYTELPDTQAGKHVQFASDPESAQTNQPSLSAQTTDTEALSADDRRHRRRRNETNQGYEASEDTDTSPADDPRSRGYDARADRDQRTSSRTNSARDRDENRSHERVRDSDRHRERDRDYDRDYDRGHDRDRDREHRDRDNRSSPRQRSRRDNRDDGYDSDATIELEPRFDDKGRKKPERGEDPLADRLDDILAGKGSAGKAFGNFVDGLMGGEKGKGQDRDRDRDRRRRD